MTGIEKWNEKISLSFGLSPKVSTVRIAHLSHGDRSQLPSSNIEICSSYFMSFFFHKILSWEISKVISFHCTQYKHDSGISNNKLTILQI